MDREQTVARAASPAVGYVLKGFPRLSELFIASEIYRLEAHGVRLRLFVIKRGEPLVPHEIVGRIQARPEYLPQTETVSGVSLWRWLAAHLARFLPAIRRTIRRRPVGVLRAMTTMLTLAVRTRPDIWSLPRKGYVKELLLAFALADRLLDQSDVKHLHAHFCHGATTVTWLAAVIVGLPFSFTAHAKDIYSPSLNPPGLLGRKLAAARFAVTCTEANRAYLARLAGRTPVHRIYHGLNAEFLVPPQEGVRLAFRPFQGWHVLAVGRLVEKKGFDVLVEACAMLKARGVPLDATIVGEDGEHAAVVDGRISDLQLTGCVRRVPAIGQAALYRQYRSADVFCLPCRVAEDGDRDGIPNVLVEAMASGLPVVTTRLSGIPELVVDGTNGLLVPPDDATATADALYRLFSEPSLAARLAEEAQKTVRQRFDGDRLAGELAALFTREVA